ncbi:MAG: sulfatase [Acidobacteria bacterium]|nr:sulfatase [Acidobacteriota bacterium]
MRHTLRLRAALCALALLLQLSAPAGAKTRAQRNAPKKKLNVLFLISDDLRPELGAYGNTQIKTPNIDRLAARGTRFARAYAQYPLCNPSRTSLLTGRYPTETGVMDNNKYFRAEHPDWVTLPQYFKNNGYATLRTGKIFHGGIDDEVSWTEGGEPIDPSIVYRGSNARNAPPAARPRERDPDEEEGTAPGQMSAAEGERRRSNSDRIVVLEGDGESHGDYKTATRAIDYLERYKDKPFFLAVGFVKPHSPPTAPRKFFDLYDVARVPLPPDFAPRPAPPPGFPELSVPRRNADLFIGRDATPEQAREMIRAYWASTSFVDAQVGRVIDTLERLGLKDNTVVVFWGDHGYHLGEKGKWSKAYSLFEVGTRVPLIIAVPGGRAQATARNVELQDLYPTLADLCGLPRPPANVRGRSLAPLLKNPRARRENDAAYSVTLFQNKLGRAVRTERFRYVEWDEGRAGAMLFDETKDPHELKNLAEDPAYAKTVQEMKGLLKQFP